MPCLSFTHPRTCSHFILPLAAWFGWWSTASDETVAGWTTHTIWKIEYSYNSQSFSTNFLLLLRQFSHWMHTQNNVNTANISSLDIINSSNWYKTSMPSPPPIRSNRTAGVQYESNWSLWFHLEYYLSLGNNFVRILGWGSVGTRKIFIRWNLFVGVDETVSLWSYSLLYSTWMYHLCWECRTNIKEKEKEFWWIPCYEI